MMRFSSAEPVAAGLVIDKPRQSYRVETVLMDEPGWAICVMAKTRGVYEGNHVTAEITKKGS